METLYSGPLPLSLEFRGGRQGFRCRLGRFLIIASQGHVGVVDVLLVTKATNIWGWPADTTNRLPKEGRWSGPVMLLPERRHQGVV